MVRLLFCLFADDTGIFETKDDFLYLIEERTDADGANVGRILNELFEVLDTDRSDRVAGLDPEFDKFPYVNGALFKGHLRTAVRSEEHTSEIQSLMRISYAVFRLKKKIEQKHLILTYYPYIH